MLYKCGPAAVAAIDGVEDLPDDDGWLVEARHPGKHLTQQQALHSMALTMRQQTAVS